MEVVHMRQMSVLWASTLSEWQGTVDLQELFVGENQDLSVERTYICIILDIKSTEFEREACM